MSKIGKIIAKGKAAQAASPQVQPVAPIKAAEAVVEKKPGEGVILEDLSAQLDQAVADAASKTAPVKAAKKSTAGPKLVVVNGSLKQKTNKYLLVLAGDKEQWFMKDSLTDFVIHDDQTVEMTMPAAMAKRKGLAA
jgi:hypothetical protein